MSANPTDPLLRGTRILLLIVMALAVIAAAALVVAIPALLLWPEKISVIADGQAAGPGFVGAIAALLGAVIAILVLAILFLRQLVAVIDSVKLGSPFEPANVRRLRIMAWLMLGMEAVGLLTTPLQAMVAAQTPQADLEVSFSFSGLVTALLLFILARVFAHGTQLAEDVEGTV